MVSHEKDHSNYIPGSRSWHIFLHFRVKALYSHCLPDFVHMPSLHFLTYSLYIYVECSDKCVSFCGASLLSL